MGGEVADDAYGDGDGIPEGGETIEMNVTIANFGAEAISDVTLTLSIDDASIVVTDPTAYIGTIAANDSVNSAGDPQGGTIFSRLHSRRPKFILLIQNQTLFPCS